jgi:PAS domain S-box-containing protein
MRLRGRCLAAAVSIAAMAAMAVQAAPRVVRVGVYENPPKLLAGPQGQASGILGDLLGEMARLEDWTLEPVPCEWERCLRLLEQGQIDLMPDVAYSDARAQRYDFHRVPALPSWSQVYRRPGVALQSVLDLDGKRVVVLEGSVQQEHLAGLLNSFGLHAELVPVRSFDEAFGLVAAGSADAVAANRYSGDAAASRYGLAASSLVFLPSRLYFATDKGRNADLLAAIDARLDAWQKDAHSVYFQTLARWGQQTMAPRVPPAFWWGLAVVLGLLALALAFLALLRREVTRRTLALRHSEERFRRLAENSADWIWEHDLRGRHTYSNPGVTAILGYRVDAFLAIDATSLVHPDDLALFEATHRQARAQRTGWRNVIIRWRHQDGGYRVLESNAQPVLDAKGALQGFQGVDRDITERVLAEQERQRLAAILEATTDIVSMADPEGHPIYLNGPGRAMLGLGPEGPLPEGIAHVHPRWAADLILGEGLQTAIRDGRWSGETAVLGPHGEEIPMSQLILSHKDPQGKLLFLSTIMRDIRESRAAEQALRELNASLEARVAERTAKLTAANQELETFAYAVSHDLRAPLRAMIGYSSALQEDHAAALPGEAQRFIRQIVQAGRKMSDLVDGLLTLARSTRGDLRMDRVDVSALAQRRLAELAAAEPTRRVVVEVEPGLTVQGDERMMSSVLDNLLDNAWKYTGATAQPRVWVRACTRAGLQGFSVSDNGAGFDMTHADRLFKAFQRLHRQDDFPGIGIGLATVERIVQRHGGQISAHGVPGQGASFSVLLPAEPGPSPAGTGAP